MRWIKDKRHYMQAIQMLQLLIGLLFTTQLVLCTEDYNPFQDTANSRAVIISSLKNNDTLAIYSTQMITVQLEVVNLISQFRVEVDSNRFLSDTTINKNQFDLSAPVRFSFKLSFFDTGWHEIKITATHTEGDNVVSRLRLYASMPLLQSKITGEMGDSILLVAPPVKDSDVIYQWTFDNGSKIESPFPQQRSMIRPTNNSGSGTGMIKICDSYHLHSSPQIRFDYKLIDNKPPQINYANTNKDQINGDTITVSESKSVFSVYITDAGMSNITATVNKDSLATDNNLLFFKTFDHLDTVQGYKRLEVEASDSKNKATKTFFLKYSAFANIPVLIIDVPSNDRPESKSEYCPVSGRIRKYSAADSVRLLKIKVNGSFSGDSVPIIVSTQDNFWNFDIKLEKGLNKLEVFVYDTRQRFITSKPATIIYDQNYIDTLPTKIIDLTINQQKGIGESFNLADSIAKIRILAYNGAGITKVSVNNDTAKKVDYNKYIWEKDINLLHGKQDVHVKIIDNLGKEKDTTVRVLYNRKPVIDEMLDPPRPLLVGKLYCDTIRAYDLDTADMISYTKENGPQNLTVTNTGIVSWIPESSDTTYKEIKIMVSDRYSDTILTTPIVVKPKAPVKLRLLTTEADFPSVIQTGDSLSIPIRIDSLTGSAPYTITVDTGKKNLQVLSDKITWTPDSSDTGVQIIKITVKDNYDSLATLNPSIRVIPALKKIEYKSIWTGDTTASGSLDLQQRGSLPDTFKIKILDQYWKYRGFSASVLSGITQPTNLAFDDSAMIRIVPALENTGNGIDSFTIALKDSMGHQVTITKKTYSGIFTAPILLSPLKDSIVKDSAVTFRWRSSGESKSIQYHLLVRSSDSGSVLIADLETVDTSATIKDIKSGHYFAWVTANNTKSTVSSSVVTFLVQRSDTIAFTNVINKNKLTFLEVAKDSLKISLIVEKNRGACRFYKTGIFADSFSVDSISGDLLFKPRHATYLCSLSVVVRDSAGNRATFVTGPILVIPQNRPCSIMVSPPIDSCITLLNQSVEYTFAIIDPDTAIAESYNVKVKLFNTESSVKVDTSKRFSIKIDPPSAASSFDTLQVTVTDKGGYSATIKKPIVVKKQTQSIVYLAPADGDTIPDALVNFQWTVTPAAVPSLLYDFYIDTTTVFTLPKAKNLIQNSYKVIGLERGKMLYWKVVAHSADQEISGTKVNSIFLKKP